jgi:hypothetical protein
VTDERCSGSSKASLKTPRQTTRLAYIKGR